MVNTAEHNIKMVYSRCFRLVVDLIYLIMAAQEWHVVVDSQFPMRNLAV